MIGVHKDSGGEAEVEELGVFDSLVIADAAAMRPGSAGQVELHASSPGAALTDPANSAVTQGCHSAKAFSSHHRLCIPGGFSGTVAGFM